jgi:hypothetical protein
MYVTQTSSPLLIGFVQRTKTLGPYLRSARKELVRENFRMRHLYTAT